MVHILQRGAWPFLEFFSVFYGLVLLQSSYVFFMCKLFFQNFIYCLVVLFLYLSLLVNHWLPFWFYVLSYRKALQEESKPNANSVIFRLYYIVVGIYAGVQFFLSILMRIPACHSLTNQCDRWPLVRFVTWMRQVLILVSCHLFILSLTPGFVVSNILYLYSLVN
jgi:hypothetical protein